MVTRGAKVCIRPRVDGAVSSELELSIALHPLHAIWYDVDRHTRLCINVAVCMVCEAIHLRTLGDYIVRTGGKYAVGNQ